MVSIKDKIRNADNFKLINSKRDRWRHYHKQQEIIAAEWRKRDYSYPPPNFPQMPVELKSLICGAKAKSTGQPCKRKDIYSNGRCKLHGGLSTGPISAEGKRKSAMNGFKPKKRSPRDIEKT